MRRRRRGGPGPGLNWQLVLPVLGGALLAVGLGLAVCAVTAVVRGDGAAAAFAIPSAVVIPVSLVALLSAGRLSS
ncbi:MAG: hypothetical protein QOD81_2969, partial [Solirubrobacteraceae bacterium]|nr:hypothetical protein [Solirubrobacteraceae bacterium]